MSSMKRLKANILHLWMRLRTWTCCLTPCTINQR